MLIVKGSMRTQFLKHEFLLMHSLFCILDNALDKTIWSTLVFQMLINYIVPKEKSGDIKICYVLIQNNYRKKIGHLSFVH